MLNPYLFYNGNCEAAFKFYEKTLGARIELMLRNEQAPAEMPSPPDAGSARKRRRVEYDQGRSSTVRRRGTGRV